MGYPFVVDYFVIDIYVLLQLGASLLHAGPLIIWNDESNPAECTV